MRTDARKPLPDTLVQDRILGCIIGQAVGDALGVPFEGVEPERIAEVFPSSDRVELRETPGGNYRAGQYSDDTQMMRCILESLAEHATVVPEDIAARFVKLWETSVVGAGDACSTAVTRLRGGVPWYEAGAPVGEAGNGSAMRAALLGVWYHDNLPALVEETVRVSRITHTDERATAGAIAVATAVAYLFGRGADERFDPAGFADFVGEWVAPIHKGFSEEIKHLPARLRKPAVQAVRDIRRAGASPDRHNPWPGISGYVIPTVLASFDAFARTSDNFRESLWRVLSYGGDVDTTGAITGALSGVYNGLSGIPRKWSLNVHDAGYFGYGYLREQGMRLFELKRGSNNGDGPES